MSTTTPRLSALFVDFDNVFSHLLAIDAKAALRFTREPRVWLERLGHRGEGPQSRRWLILRCYLNPTGTVADPEHPGQRLHFDRLRRGFIDAGFEVVDCPSPSHTKNAADIRIVIDALDAVKAEPRYDEFVLASGDTDMAPLIFRLRALDRRVTVISPSDSAEVLGASADELITGTELLKLLRPAPSEAETKFRDLVVARYTTTLSPINLSTFARELHRELGAVVGESRWFGHETFLTALQSLDLPDLRTSQHFMWDQSRHTAPAAAVLTEVAADPDDLAVRLQRTIKLPNLPPEVWRGIYDQLAVFGKTHEFSISEATRWTHARLKTRGIDVSRQVIGKVMRGAASAGKPLYRHPPPDADEIWAGFVADVLDRARAAHLSLTEHEIDQLQIRLGRCDSEGSSPSHARLVSSETVCVEGHR